MALTYMLLSSMLLIGLHLAFTNGECRNFDPLTEFSNCVREHFPVDAADCQTFMEERAMCLRDLKETKCFKDPKVSQILNEQKFREAAKYGCDNFKDVKPDIMCYQGEVNNFANCLYKGGAPKDETYDTVCSLIPRYLECSAKTSGRCSTKYSVYEGMMFHAECKRMGSPPDDHYLDAAAGAIVYGLQMAVALFAMLTYIIMN